MHPADISSERAELHSVLASSLFQKAPIQSRLLRYLCNKYFENSAEPLKEHQIAVEALGRKADFDQRESSLVRVEVHRLRKKLKQFYSVEGRDHLLQIWLEPGQYIPRFERGSDAPAVRYATEILEHVDSGSSLRRWWARLANRRVLMAFAAVCAAVTIVAITSLTHKQMKSGQRTLVSEVVLAPAPGLDEVRILAGYPRSTHIDRYGRVWGGDRFYVGGHTGEAPRHFLTRTPDPTLYRYYRAGEFSYHIPLRPGVYELRVHFADSLDHWNVPDRHVGVYPVRLYINEQLAFLNLNFAADPAGGGNVDVRVFGGVTPDKDGRLHLRFATAGEFAFVNAIEITPGLRDKLKPIRMVAGEFFYTDHLGRVWWPDQYFQGGTTVQRRLLITSSEDKDLFAFEHFGDFDYVFSVAKGKYAITLGFAETWFGPKFPGGGGEGSRIFDVICNGRTSIAGLDVSREAGGSGKPLEKTIRDVRPDDSGKIRLQFKSVRNLAFVNYIEVADQGG